MKPSNGSNIQLSEALGHQHRGLDSPLLYWGYSSLELIKVAGCNSRSLQSQVWISKAHAVENWKPGAKPLSGEMLSSVLDGCLHGIPLKNKKLKYRWQIPPDSWNNVWSCRQETVPLVLVLPCVSSGHWWSALSWHRDLQRSSKDSGFFLILDGRRGRQRCLLPRL